MAEQLSFFSAESLPPSPDEIEGALLGPGRLLRREARAAVEIPTGEPWRAAALADALDDLGLGAQVTPAPTGEDVVVRTPLSAALLPMALRWTSEGGVRPPPDLVLDGRRLRWWALSGGRYDAGSASYVLPVSGDAEAWSGIGAALHQAGIAGTLVGPRWRGPAYRVTGQRRLGRLRELVGEPPHGVPGEAWPPVLPAPSAGHRRTTRS